MHKLNRSLAPVCLAKFRHGQHHWSDVSPADRDEVREQLNQMQQQRCAYCEFGIAGEKRAHIEHFRQRARYPQGTFVWDNLFSSCNHSDSCGKHKDACGPYDHQVLIKMDVEDPEYFFRFVSDGTIAIHSGLTASDQHRANETLQIFNLDAKHGRLRQMRKTAVQGYLQTAESFAEIALEYDESEWKPLLEKELEAIKYQPFSTAIKHLLMPA